MAASSGSDPSPWWRASATVAASVTTPAATTVARIALSFFGTRSYSQAIPYQRAPYQLVEYHRAPYHRAPYQRAPYHRAPLHWLSYQRAPLHSDVRNSRESKTRFWAVRLVPKSSW